MDSITFLGTGGARIVMARQLLATGGMWLKLNGTEISLDPGPGAIVHAKRKGLDPSRLKGVLISHRHLDHAGDANAMIEAMTEGGTQRRGCVFAPGDALEKDPVILRYLRPYVEEVAAVEPYRRYQVGDISFETSMPHVHGEAETYGFRFHSGGKTVGYLPDTRYFPELCDFYKADVLVIAVLLLQRFPHIAHLSVPDARTIIEAVQPQVVIMTHFGIHMWKAKPWEVADALSQETGVKVIAARDGMEFQLDHKLAPPSPG